MKGITSNLVTKSLDLYLLFKFGRQDYLELLKLIEDNGGQDPLIKASFKCSLFFWPDPGIFSFWRPRLATFFSGKLAADKNNLVRLQNIPVRR